MPKKDFTSFDLYAVVQELKPQILDARVNNVYQLDAKTLLFKLHKVSQPPIQLILEAGRRLHLTNYAQEKPQAPPAFCMALRKYLPGAWISNVEQYGFERVVTFEFKAREGTLKLVLELFGEGNLILATEQGEILQALIFKRMRDRSIVRKETYQLPPSNAQNPFQVTKEELARGLQAAGDAAVVRVLVRYLGVGGLYAEELLLRAGVEKTTPCTALTDVDVDAVFGALQGLLSPFLAQTLEPNIVLDSAEGFVDVAPVKLKRYEDFTQQSFSSFGEALDEFYVRVTAAEKAVAGIDVGQFRREAERLKRMIAEQERTLQEEDRKTAKDKQIGNTIYEHLNEMQPLLERFASTWRRGADLPALVAQVKAAKKTGSLPEAFFDSFDGKNLAITVSVGELTFSMSLRKTIYENANEFYDRGKRAKQKTSNVVAAMEDSRKKLAEIEKELGKVEALKAAAPAEAIEEVETRRVQTKEWFEKFRWFKSSEGFLVVAGKDVVSNEVLVKKYTDAYDLVFHVDIVGSPFVVIKTEGKEPGEATLAETAEFAADYSRAWRESMGAVDVYWVKPEQLSKSGPSGEFVPRGAFMVNGKRSWMRGTPLRFGLGIVETEEPYFIGGPVEAVKAQTKVYLVLVPGDSSGKDFLKQVLRSLLLKLPKEQRIKLGKASIEDIREFVPYTKGRISPNP
ncbi:MAG: ribosome rescue protein RqcH [Candidatus Bathyarchaeia archaeon]|jgi:predicted ribosome quality control (RQC) complex YloA/Tae2 family protein